MKGKLGSIIVGLFILLTCSILWVVIYGTQPATPKSDAKSGAVETNAASPASAHPSFLERITGASSRTNSLIEEARSGDGKSRDLLFIAPREPFDFGLSGVRFLQKPILGQRGQPVWEIIASLIFIGLAFCLSKFLDFILHAKLRRWAEHSETKVDDLLLDLLHGPTTLLTFVVLLHYGLELSSLFSVVLKMLVALSLTYLAVRCVDLLVLYWKERVSGPVVDKAFDGMILPVVSRSLKIFIIIVGVLLTSDNLGMNIKSVLASLSIGGLALGLAAQDTLANVFGALAVFIDKPFHIGDRIRLDSFEGTVESIGLRSTRIRNLDGHLITIPNKTMGSAIITNISRRPTIRTEVGIELTYNTPAEKIKLALQIVREVYAGHPLTHETWVDFYQFGDSGLRIRVIHFCKTLVYTEYLATMQEMHLALKRRFDDEKIDFAFPSRTIYIKTEGAPGNDGSPAIQPTASGRL